MYEIIVLERSSTILYGGSCSDIYRWEREVLSVAGSMAQQEGQDRVVFAKVPMPRQECRNEAEHSATLYVGNVRMDIYPSCGREQLKILVEMLHIC